MNSKTFRKITYKNFLLKARLKGIDYFKDVLEYETKLRLRKGDRLDVVKEDKKRLIDFFNLLIVFNDVKGAIYFKDSLDTELREKIITLIGNSLDKKYQIIWE